MIKKILSSKNKPYAKLRKWAGKDSDRLQKVVDYTDTKAKTTKKKAVDKKAAAAELAARQDRLQAKANEQWKEARKLTAAIDKEKKKATPNTATIDKLTAERRTLHESLNKLEAHRREAQAEHKAAKVSFGATWRRYLGWVKLRTIYRGRLKKAKAASRPKFEPWMANGQPYDCLNSKLKSAIAVAVTRYGQVVTSTTGGTHAPTSFHYSCRAVDIAGPYSGMVGFQGWLAKQRGSGSLEIFGPDNYYYKYGSRYSGAFPAHGDHVHYADE